MRFALLLPIIFLAGCAQYNWEASTLMLDNTSIVWLGHASFLIEAHNKTIYIDPYVLPNNPKQADLILVTHDHFDHAGVEQVKSIRGENTILFGTTEVVRKLAFGNPIKDGMTFDADGFTISTVKAYNIDKFNSYEELYHPNGTVVGYVIEIDGKCIYHAGDTDVIPEMAYLKTDVALLPIGGRYTMTVKEAAVAAKMIKPKIVVPMHYNSARYGIQGIEANPTFLILDLAGTNITVSVLEPLVK